MRNRSRDPRPISAHHPPRHQCTPECASKLSTSAVPTPGATTHNHPPRNISAIASCSQQQTAEASSSFRSTLNEATAAVRKWNAVPTTQNQTAEREPAVMPEECDPTSSQRPARPWPERRKIRNRRPAHQRPAPPAIRVRNFFPSRAIRMTEPVTLPASPSHESSTKARR